MCYETTNNEIGRSVVYKYDMIGVCSRIKGRSWSSTFCGVPGDDKIAIEGYSMFKKR